LSGNNTPTPAAYPGRLEDNHGHKKENIHYVD